MSEIVRCVVAGYNGNGDPDFFFCKVRVDGDEVAVCTGDHYDIAKDAAKAHGFIPEAEEGAFVVFDEHDGPKALFDMFVWDSASVV